MTLAGFARSALSGDPFSLKGIVYDADNAKLQKEWSLKRDSVLDIPGEDTLLFNGDYSDSRTRLDSIEIWLDNPEIPMRAEFIQANYDVREAFYGSISGFEHFATDPYIDHSYRCFRVHGNEEHNHITLTSGSGNLNGYGGDDTFTIYENRSPITTYLNGGASRNDLARLKGQWEFSDIVITHFSPEDQARALEFTSPSGSRVLVHESTEEVFLYDSFEIIEFEEAWSTFRAVISDENPTSLAANELAGSCRNEDIHGFFGRDVMTGQGGADRFYLENSESQALNLYSDLITDFDPSEDDKIYISSQAFGVNAREADVLIASNPRESALASRDNEVPFIYEEFSGRIYFNSNRRDSDLMATLTDESNLLLTAEDFVFI